MEPIDKKFQAFGRTVKVIDGHDFSAIQETFEYARLTSDVPTVVLAETLVGKGIPFLENLMSHNMVLPADVANQCLKYLRSEQ